MKRNSDADFDVFVADPGQMVGVIVRKLVIFQDVSFVALVAYHGAIQGARGNINTGPHYMVGWMSSVDGSSPSQSELAHLIHVSFR